MKRANLIVLVLGVALVGILTGFARLRTQQLRQTTASRPTPSSEQTKQIQWVQTSRGRAPHEDYHDPNPSTDKVVKGRVNERGIPTLISDVPGVLLVPAGIKTIPQPQGPPIEIAELDIQNTTKEGIDAFRVTGGEYTVWQDARESGPPGSYTLSPAVPLIPPDHQLRLTFELNNVPGGQPVRLAAVVFHDGTIAGTERDKQRIRAARAHVALEHGMTDPAQ